MRHKALSGIQEMLVIPGEVEMKACFGVDIWDRCEGRAGLPGYAGYVMQPKQGRFTPK